MNTNIFLCESFQNENSLLSQGKYWENNHIWYHKGGIISRELVSPKKCNNFINVRFGFSDSLGSWYKIRSRFLHFDPFLDGRFGFSDNLGSRYGRFGFSDDLGSRYKYVLNFSILNHSFFGLFGNPEIKNNNFSIVFFHLYNF